jgi:hypothetical protein
MPSRRIMPIFEDESGSGAAATCRLRPDSLINAGLNPLACKLMETAMSVVKVIELIAESPTSWEDAASKGLAEAGKSVRGIKSMYIKEFEAKVENEKVVGYRVIAKVSFLIEGSQ